MENEVYIVMVREPENMLSGPHTFAIAVYDTLEKAENATNKLQKDSYTNYSGCDYWIEGMKVQ